MSVLQKTKKQATTIIFREINNSYSSKGVWVIREAIKTAFEKKPFVFDDLNSALTFIDSLGIKNGVGYCSEKSEILKEIKCQKRLCDFL